MEEKHDRQGAGPGSRQLLGGLHAQCAAPARGPARLACHRCPALGRHISGHTLWHLAPCCDRESAEIFRQQHLAACMTQQPASLTWPWPLQCARYHSFLLTPLCQLPPLNSPTGRGHHLAGQYRQLHGASEAARADHLHRAVGRGKAGQSGKEQAAAEGGSRQSN